MEFNIQSYLHDMRMEQQKDHQELSGKLDDVFDVIGKHETRIVVVEGTRKTLIWLGSALIVALLAFVGDMLANHLPHVVAAITAGEHK